MSVVIENKVKNVGTVPAEQFMPFDITFECAGCTESEMVDFSIGEMYQVHFWGQIQMSMEPYKEGDNPFDNCTISTMENYCVDCVDEALSNLEKHEAIGATAIPLLAMYEPINK